MRILGFNKKWPKLQQEEFTTFRFARKDKDWEVGEIVRIIIKPRSEGGGEFLGLAEIIRKEPRNMSRVTPNQYPSVTLTEAQEDGFDNYWAMWDWLWDIYGGKRLVDEPMNKLTLSWKERR